MLTYAERERANSEAKEEAATNSLLVVRKKHLLAALEVVLPSVSARDEKRYEVMASRLRQSRAKVLLLCVCVCVRACVVACRFPCFYIPLSRYLSSMALRLRQSRANVCVYVYTHTRTHTHTHTLRYMYMYIRIYISIYM